MIASDDFQDMALIYLQRDLELYSCNSNLTFHLLVLLLPKKKSGWYKAMYIDIVN